MSLPPALRSVRLRLTLLYSGILFLLTAALLGALYAGLALTLDDRHLATAQTVQELVRTPSGGLEPGRLLVDVQAFERRVNATTLTDLRRFSFAALGVLFVASLGVGWVVAGRALAPVARIAQTAREIQAGSLSRRIALQGPDDELKRLADTFDSMLERLDAAFAAQRRFVADASHELRTPLAIIQANLDVALADPAAPVEERERAAAVIRRAIARMTRLTEDLLALARLDAPGFRFELVDLDAVLADAAEELAPAAGARALRIDRGAVSRAAAVGDRDALKRAVVNLLDNAVRLAPPGSRISLAAGRENGHAWLSVADEGPGIAAADRERIFDRFHRLDEGRSSARGGSGLGLAIVREIAHAHGGEVSVSSGGPGSGSTFVLSLPQARRDASGAMP